MSTIYTSEHGRDRIAERYREHLATWPVPWEQRLVPTAAGETFVLDCGPADAPPLVLLHGSGSNTSAWRGDITEWAAHFRVYAVDLPGEPGFSAPTRLALDTAACANWLDEVLDGLGLDTVSMTGMSLGGWTALDYVTRKPGRVEALALLCPGGLGRHRYGWLVKAVGLRLLGRHSVRDMARTGLGLTGPAAEAILDDVELVFSHFSARSGNLPRFSEARLRAVDIPVLVIVGERDALFDSAGTARRARLLTEGEVQVLPDVGHAVLGQAERISRFLRSR
ncbi:alpha/beta fold hydrolase [Nocardia sp. NPDC023988]|uniref:alpha/beta fold hydrolase n=1 Tax=unclassified Nocardia TaxID=2637762 RepID=UPI00340FFF13